MIEHSHLVFYSIVLNNHQAMVADELWELTGHSYCFVELVKPSAENSKGGGNAFCKRPYLLKAWESAESWNKAMDLAREADCCVFSGVPALPFQQERMRLGKLSFDMSERWLKRGWINLFSSAILRMTFAYLRGGWGRKPLFKLCCSGFAAEDHRRLGMYRGRCFKWGYFTEVPQKSLTTKNSFQNPVSLMWCARYLDWKHPELPVLMAERLKNEGYKFHLDMCGEGEWRQAAELMVRERGLEDCVSFIDNRPNAELLEDMGRHDIFLFTSDRNEGWGAVANESMAQGCALVASEAIGSTPYLIQDGVTGLIFKAPSTRSGFAKPDHQTLDSLCEKVRWLLDNPEKAAEIRTKASRFMREVYSPRVAAERLLKLIEALKGGQPTPFADGPCSQS